MSVDSKEPSTTEAKGDPEQNSPEVSGAFCSSSIFASLDKDSFESTDIPITLKLTEHLL